MTYLNGASWRLFWCDIECSAVTLTSSIANRLQYCRPSWCHVWITPLCRAQTDIQPNNIIKKRNNKKVEIFKLGHDNRTAWTDERQPNNKRPRLYGYNIVVSSCFAYGRHSNISFSKQSRNTKKQNVECHQPADRRRVLYLQTGNSTLFSLSGEEMRFSSSVPTDDGLTSTKCRSRDCIRTLGPLDASADANFLFDFYRLNFFFFYFRTQEKKKNQNRLQCVH